MLKPASAAALLTISLIVLPMHGSTQGISDGGPAALVSPKATTATDDSADDNYLPSTTGGDGNFAPPSIGGNAAFIYPLVTTYGGGR